METGTTASARPSDAALRGRMFLPVRPCSSATWRPTFSARRWRPLAPGSRPSCTSGRPRTVFLSSESTRPWHASATSNPPPSAAPCRAATTGLARSAIFCMAAWPVRQRASASAAVCAASSMVRSAPAMKLSRLPETSTAALIVGSPTTSAKTRSKSAAKLALSVFTGSPGASYVMTATPSSRTRIESAEPVPGGLGAEPPSLAEAEAETPFMRPPGPRRRRGRRPRRR